MTYIDDLIADEEEIDSKSGSKPKQEVQHITPEDDEETEDDEGSSGGKVLVGVVERFFSKLNVAAIKLSRDLKVGDMVEIDNTYGPVQTIIVSMQIDRTDVEEASAGDSIGIKVDELVEQGSKVYLLADPEE